MTTIEEQRPASGEEASREKRRIYARAYYRANKEKIAEYQREHYQKNIERRREQNRKDSAERNKRSQEHATRSYKPWAPWEDHYIVGYPELSLTHIAKRLGRTVAAVSTRRSTIKGQESTL